MERIHKIHFAAFGYNVHVIITDNIVESRVKRDKIFGIYKHEDYETIGLHSYSNSRLLSALFFKENSTVETITHECSHAIDQMFLTIGAEMIDTEIRAYHLGYIAGQVWDVLQKKSTKQSNMIKVTDNNGREYEIPETMKPEFDRLLEVGKKEGNYIEFITAFSRYQK